MMFRVSAPARRIYVPVNLGLTLISFVFIPDIQALTACRPRETSNFDRKIMLSLATVASLFPMARPYCGIVWQQRPHQAGLTRVHRKVAHSTDRPFPQTHRISLRMETRAAAIGGLEPWWKCDAIVN
ncbi:hypothetical protein BJX70DRAFT_43653 [Aspergillus crustosus]